MNQLQLLFRHRIQSKKLRILVNCSTRRNEIGLRPSSGTCFCAWWALLFRLYLYVAHACRSNMLFHHLHTFASFLSHKQACQGRTQRLCFGPTRPRCHLFRPPRHRCLQYVRGDAVLCVCRRKGLRRVDVRAGVCVCERLRSRTELCVGAWMDGYASFAMYYCTFILWLGLIMRC